MMIHYSQMVDAPRTSSKKKKVSDTIYTLDIETTSLFHFPNKWDVFRDDLPGTAYMEMEKIAVPYIWMFGIEADNKCNVYYGREFMELESVFLQIADPDYRKIIYIHNAGYEFQFLRDIFEKYTVKDMCCQKARKPIRWIVEELNIEFRCSYLLTGLSLEKAAERYTKLRKKTGDLDYNSVIRSPLTTLTMDEMGYCEYDILTLHHIIMKFRDAYGSLSKIPLTQTGEVRRDLRNRVDFKYIYHIRDQVPHTAHIQMLLMAAFWGGITHASYLHAGRVLHDIVSSDQTSAYPAAIGSYRFPCGRWIPITPKAANGLNRDHWAVLYHVILHDIDSRLINTYILGSKALRAFQCHFDNGRVLDAEMIELVLTEIDFDIIRDAYEIGRIEYVEVYMCRKDWMPRELIMYMLELYKNKTSLKNVDGMEDFYMNSKQRINSLYGCCATNVIKNSTDYINGEWTTRKLTDELIEEKLEEQRKSKTNCFAYHWAPWVTAICRARTWSIIRAIDTSVVGVNKGAVYYDTDSCKSPDSPELQAALRRSNEDIQRRQAEMCTDLEIDPDLLAPADPDGVKHPLGLWEKDGEYQEFITLGAKRYSYKDNKGLHIVVSGVNSKKGVTALQNRIENFKKDMEFGYKESGKLTSCYIDDQPTVEITDCDGNSYVSTQRHGIVLQPTTYNMSVDAVFEALWEIETDKGDRIID